jgi:hypothetical protein
VAGFAAAVGEFLGKDLTVVRQVAADLGADLGALNDAHAVLAGLLEAATASPATASPATASPATASPATASPATPTSDPSGG